mmetsp:Transcript_42868/g.67224  ORF Transcript_42868/g.67224 Transcript_42868/m.67224 type:complete len:321 (-) Transcript_42868:377-1339(-)
MSVCTMHVHEPQQLKSGTQSAPSVLPSLSSVLHTLMGSSEGGNRAVEGMHVGLGAAPRGLMEVKVEGSSSSGPSAPASPPWLHAAEEKMASQPAGLRLTDVDVSKIPKPLLELPIKSKALIRKEEGRKARQEPVQDSSVAASEGPLDSQVNEVSKRWKEKLDGVVHKSNQEKAAYLRLALKGLQDALPQAAKSQLVICMKDYMDKKTTPEQFAEAIKVLVDKHNVVVTCPAQRPADRQRPALATFPPKPEIAAEPKKRSSPEPTSNGSNALPEERAGGRSARKTKAQRKSLVPAESMPSNANMDTSAMAWEALVSVCARM